MPDRVVIVDTSPLLYLHQVGLLDLLRKLYGSVLVPPAVVEELEKGRKIGVDVPDVALLDWIVVHPVGAVAFVPAIVDLDKGEAEVIALALELDNRLLVLDDQLARRIADLYQIKYTGTLGVLIKAKQDGYLTSIRDTIIKLKNKGLWLHEDIVKIALRLAGEQMPM